MSFEVITTSFFEKQARKLAKKHASIKQDILALINSLESNPIQGVSLGKDCYKVRLAIKSKSRGKSGGARVITCVKVINAKVYLLSIYDKGDKENLDEQELSLLLEMMAAQARDK